MLLPHNKVSGGVQDSQIMIPSFFDRFYVMPPLTNGVHYMFNSLQTCSTVTCDPAFISNIRMASETKELQTSGTDAARSIRK